VTEMLQKKRSPCLTPAIVCDTVSDGYVMIGGDTVTLTGLVTEVHYDDRW
jgi:hypothetical protein